MEASGNRSSLFLDVVEQLCHKLNGSCIFEGLERVNYAREKLAILQQTEAFPIAQKNLKHVISAKVSDIRLNQSLRPSQVCELKSKSFVALEEEHAEEEEPEFVHCDALSDDAWLGFFKGFEILSENQRYTLNENKQCIEISIKTSEIALDAYLRSGIRCFMIDLFKGTGLQNQGLILKLRESELSISREFGFPVLATLFAALSPRYQYVGVLEDASAYIHLEKGKTIILTTNREFSINGNRNKIYVNAHYLIEDCRIGDVLLIGHKIQIRITEIENNDLTCCIMVPGNLRSRLPVRFPARCDRYSLSLEELEDITFAREVGIGVLISHTAGTISYFEDLQNTLYLLKCDTIRIGSRIVLNEIRQEDADLQWMAERYDCFIMDFSPWQQHEKCIDTELLALKKDMLYLAPKAKEFLLKIFELKKPIIMDPTLINDLQLYVHPCNTKEVFYIPDKYLFRSDNPSDFIYFCLLQNDYFKDITKFELSKPLFCDKSHTGSDSIARACAAASTESRAAAILVCSNIPDMSIKISHFRPKAPIIYISSLNSTVEYISMHHNIIYLYFRRDCCPISHKKLVTSSLTFGLLFLKSRKMIKNCQNVMLVYGCDTGTKLPDKYVAYKFDEKNFYNHLSDVLFK